MSHMYLDITRTDVKKKNVSCLLRGFLVFYYKFKDLCT